MTSLEDYVDEGSLVAQIIKLEETADRWAEKSQVLSGQIAQAGEKYSECKWEAARLISQALEEGKSGRQLAREIGKDHKHVAYMSRAWDLWGLKSPVEQLPPFNRVYNSDEVRHPNAPTPAPKPTPPPPPAPRPTQQPPLPRQTPDPPAQPSPVIACGGEEPDEPEPAIPEPPVTDDPREALTKACVQGILAGKSQTAIGRERDLSNNSMELARAYGAAEERLKASRDKTVRKGRVSNWNEKTNPQRLRELQGKPKGDYTELLKFQIEIAKLCTVLEDFNVRDYGEGETELWRIIDISDDLTTLGEWWDRQMSAVLGYLNAHEVLAKINKLRNNTEGRTPEEIEVAHRLADKLEQKLNQRSLVPPQGIDHRP